MRECLFCGSGFTWERATGQRGRPALYCSTRCKSRAKVARRGPRLAAPADPIVRSAASSIAASAKWGKLTAAERSEQLSRVASARYTPEQSAARAAKLADLEARRQTPCPYCGDPVGRAGRVKCPKPECNLAHNAKRMGIYIHVRRANKRSANAERFEPTEIFERDGWYCGICDLPVEPNLRHPDPGSPSLDHIIPLARGGEHTRANTQCAHLYCNSVKGARTAV